MKTEEQVAILGIDIAKTVFQLHGNTAQGKCVMKKKLSRKKLPKTIANMPACKIFMEACGGANYWARKFCKYGHEVQLISPQFVKPYLKGNKHDASDAEAIAEAGSRPSMRFVPIKETWQQDIQSVHRVRARLVKTRIGLSNQLRGILQEYGIAIARGYSSLRQTLPMILEDAENELTSMTREIVSEIYEELQELDKRLDQYNKKIEMIYQSNATCQRIGKIEGVGPLIATAIIASIGDASLFKNGRQFSAWMGLVPRQHSSGGCIKLLGISKRGDEYLRRILIHGARSVVYRAKNYSDSRNKWIAQKKLSRGNNKACVALANKNARIIWALIAKDKEYRKAV